ncbi:MULTISPECIES: DmsC/YnfH family molybdoenzyme membrane anchor subunit [Proteus]|uniref:Anaerobic dimethyl sulfoxide reductase chain C n=2 Tax=Enterobacterales TaxID=91347 RepID=A0A379FDY3_PROVU|nr:MULTISPECIES: DmsC/YnfH family molybdoenzyme membrane anchor subunit [Proteus]NBN60860.1 dimethyl sulfoxide reductase anchor subunit [Proteus sp. G2639]RNT29112.1 dimethylsulfoxide reductase [Proteus mirabilis]AYY80635.1 dimethylsulfoxide reductase [Proteus vulgaris]MBG5969686.1 dimethyl sulfoxide reductase anchor subunit family protein [Proteus vulgaris]MBG5983401.1 dimethyl sulfoxide reductase anchor subunit family protein [Proteus vulgaris]
MVGLHEWPLMFFTVIGQSVAGAFIIMGCAILSGKFSPEMNRKVHYSMFGLWALMGIGFLLSMMHMGTPLRAFNSLLRLGHSSLSNEIASGSIFFALGGIYWLLAVLNKMPATLGKLWVTLVIILAALFITAISRVYQIDTVPTWYNNYTTFNFVLTAFIGGPILAALLMRIAGFNLNCVSALPLLSVIAIIVSAIVATSQGFELGSIQTSVQKAVDLVPNYGTLMGIKLVALALGLSCWIAPLLRKNNPSVALLALGFILVFVGEFIGRGVFYGLHMTVGMAVVG